MPDATSVLVLFAHPGFERSRVNSVLVDAVRQLPWVTFVDLYEKYPELDIRVDEEQALLLAHDVVVLQHPFLWYSSPAILKEYQDLVLAHGWAYGRGGTALRGKRWLQVVTTGGGRSAYTPGGLNEHPVRDLLLPFERTAALCGMEYLPPFVAYGALRMSPGEARRHAEEYRLVLEALRDGRLDAASLDGEERINAEHLIARCGEGRRAG